MLPPLLPFVPPLPAACAPVSLFSLDEQLAERSNNDSASTTRERFSPRPIKPGLGLDESKDMIFSCVETMRSSDPAGE